MSELKLYKEQIIDHYKHPRNVGELSNPDYKAQVSNSVCGDEVTVCIRERKGTVTDVRYKGTGCAISIAGSSILSEKLIGMSKKEVELLQDDFILNLLGMDARSPRVKCATLGLEAVRRALTQGDDDPCDFC